MTGRLVSVLMLVGVCAASKCAAVENLDCNGDDISKVANVSSVMTQDHCCAICDQSSTCKVAVYVPVWQGESLCLLKSGCTGGGVKSPNRVRLCPASTPAGVCGKAPPTPPTPPPTPATPTPPPTPAIPTPPPSPAPTSNVDRADCVKRCNDRGHCCTDSADHSLSSECNHPSCAMGCAIASHTSEVDECLDLCKTFDVAQNCSFDFGGDHFGTCGNCPKTCGADISPQCSGATSYKACQLGCTLGFRVVSPLTEPFPALHGYNATGNPSVPSSPDDLVRYTWDASVDPDGLQTFAYSRAAAVAVEPESAFGGLESMMAPHQPATPQDPLGPATGDSSAAHR
jgi:hypothetical protein